MTSVAAPGAGVRELFDANARTYDRVNTMLSFGLDARWRRWAAARTVSAGVAGDVARVGGREAVHVLDAFAGTGLVGLEEAALGADVTLADVSPRMLEVAQARAVRRGLHVSAVDCDLTGSLAEMPGAPFDAVSVGFGVRYLDDPVAVLARLCTVVRPGGRLVLLEVVEPEPSPLSRLGSFYFFHVVPAVASALTGHPELYRRLAETTHAIGDPPRFVDLAVRAGFCVEEVRLMGLGMIVGVVASKPTGPSPA